MIADIDEDAVAGLCRFNAVVDTTAGVFTEAERAKLKKDLEKCEKEIEMLERKLSNAEFCAKAPEKVVEAEREKLKKQLALRESLQKAAL